MGFFAIPRWCGRWKVEEGVITILAFDGGDGDVMRRSMIDVYRRWLCHNVAMCRAMIGIDRKWLYHGGVDRSSRSKKLLQPPSPVHHHVPRQQKLLDIIIIPCGNQGCVG